MVVVASLFVMVVVVRSFCYGGFCKVLLLWWLLLGPFIMMVVVRSFYGMCPVMVARLYYGTHLMAVRSYYNQTL